MRFVHNFGLLVASAAVALLLAELVLRIVGFSAVSFWVPDDQLGTRLRANADGWFRQEGEAHVVINSAGFRDAQREKAKPPGTFRIAVLGDSYAEALQVDISKTFWRVLERELSRCPRYKGQRVEVLNFGVSGYGTAQELLTYRLFASQYSPDVVLLAFFPGNDVRNNSKELETERMRPFFVLQDHQLVLDDSFKYSAEFKRRTNTLRTVLDRLRFLRIVQGAYFLKDNIQSAIAAAEVASVPSAEAGLSEGVYGPPQDETWERAWRVTDAIIGLTAREAQQRDAKLVVALLSSGIQVHPDPAVRQAFQARLKLPDLDYPERRLAAATAKHDVTFIPLTGKLARFAEMDNVYFHGFPKRNLGTGHWNEKGHQVAGELIADAFCKLRDM